MWASMHYLRIPRTVVRFPGRVFGPRFLKLIPGIHKQFGFHFSRHFVVPWYPLGWLGRAGWPLAPAALRVACWPCWACPASSHALPYRIPSTSASSYPLLYRTPSRYHSKKHGIQGNVRNSFDLFNIPGHSRNPLGSPGDPRKSISFLRNPRKSKARGGNPRRAGLCMSLSVVGCLFPSLSFSGCLCLSLCVSVCVSVCLCSTTTS